MDISMPRLQALLLSTTLCALNPLAAVHAQDVEVDAFVPPKFDNFEPPSYPNALMNQNKEAWVEVTFMVDEEGKPFEPVVSNSTGSEAFHGPAINAVMNNRFVPARLGGQPIVASMRFRLNFVIDGATGARERFARPYRSFFRAYEEGEQEKMRSALDALVNFGGQNHYEDALLNFAQAMYAQKYGTPLDQMYYFEAALSYGMVAADQVYLPVEQARYARVELLRTQIINKYLGEAVETYNYFKETADTDIVDQFKPVMDSIMKLEHEGPAIDLSLTLPPTGSIWVQLLKHRVFVQNVVGKVSEFKLRCTQHYIGFPVEPEVSYDVPDEWGECNLEIVGDAGTTLDLMQH